MCRPRLPRAPAIRAYVPRASRLPRATRGLLAQPTREKRAPARGVPRFCGGEALAGACHRALLLGWDFFSISPPTFEGVPR